jgi:hypothetical protein
MTAVEAKNNFEQLLNDTTHFRVLADSNLRLTLTLSIILVTGATTEGEWKHIFKTPKMMAL